MLAGDRNEEVAIVLFVWGTKSQKCQIAMGFVLIESALIPKTSRTRTPAQRVDKSSINVGHRLLAWLYALRAICLSASSASEDLMNGCPLASGKLVTG
jgi:hypothetical protein